jgi:hypothetical protein
MWVLLLFWVDAIGLMLVAIQTTNGGCADKAAVHISSYFVTKDGKRSFAADANVYVDFHKADVRIKCMRGKSTNGHYADGSCFCPKAEVNLFVLYSMYCPKTGFSVLFLHEPLREPQIAQYCSVSHCKYYFAYSGMSALASTEKGFVFSS